MKRAVKRDIGGPAAEEPTLELHRGYTVQVKFTEIPAAKARAAKARAARAAKARAAKARAAKAPAAARRRAGRPYNPYLLEKYDAHMNVEICSSTTSVKYL